MRISADLMAMMNAQIGRELESSNQYLNMSAWFDDLALKLLAGMFRKQSDEERTHALKFVDYLNDIGGKVEVPAIDAAVSSYSSVVDAIEHALQWELNITGDIDRLIDQAIKDNDHAARVFLDWFATEQVEEVKTMEDLLKVARAAGERQAYMVEAYLVHLQKAG